MSGIDEELTASDGFTEAERAAIKQRAEELRAERSPLIWHGFRAVTSYALRDDIDLRRCAISIKSGVAPSEYRGSSRGLGWRRRAARP